MHHDLYRMSIGLMTARTKKLHGPCRWCDPGFAPMMKFPLGPGELLPAALTASLRPVIHLCLDAGGYWFFAFGSAVQRDSIM